MSGEVSVCYVPPPVTCAGCSQRFPADDVIRLRPRGEVGGALCAPCYQDAILWAAKRAHEEKLAACPEDFPP